MSKLQASIIIVAAFAIIFFGYSLMQNIDAGSPHETANDSVNAQVEIIKQDINQNPNDAGMETGDE